MSFYTASAGFSAPLENPSLRVEGNGLFVRVPGGTAAIGLAMFSLQQRRRSAIRGR